MTKKRLIVLLVLVALVAACAKAKAQRESEWHGLTEREARDRLASKLPGKIPDDKREAISDKVIATMREKGVLSEDDADAEEADVVGIGNPT